MRNLNQLKRKRHVFTIPLIIVFLVAFNQSLLAQVPTCDATVPYFFVDLTGQPAGQWTSPTHSRQGSCCGSPTRCTSFEVILDSNAAMVEVGFDLVNDPSQALPTGALYYQIGCGPEIPVGTPICITGPGPHHITFCKPGNNQNTYYVRSIPKPLFPNDDTVRIGCSNPINVLGLEQNSVTWQSVFPGTPGQYDSYLSCTSNCTTVVYTPEAGAPAYVDYKICGFPIADECGFVGLCDTVRIYNFDALTGSVTPNPGTFCAGGSGVLLTASQSGGSAPYTYIWRDQLSNVVGSSSSYNATIAGSYQVEIRDGLYDPAYCPALFVGAPVVVTQPPVVDAGFDQTLCYNNAQVLLTGSVVNATGGIWSGGAGSFTPSNTFLNPLYTPTAAEIASGQINLIFTSTGAGGGCTEDADTVVISFTSPLVINILGQNILCAGDSTSLNASVTGGSLPYSYLWSTGETSSSISVQQGTYCLSVSDGNGCIADPCFNVTAPDPLTLSTTSTDVSVNGGSDGSATAMPGGGNAPYTYLWNSTPSQTTSTANNLSYGIYDVLVTDSNGCTINSSVVVNEPRCSGLEGILESVVNVSCFGENNGMASISISGGTDPYTILWSDPSAQTNDTASNLSAGAYQALITDSNLCYDLINVAITQPTYLYGTITQINVTTEGGNDGAASLNPFGGTPGYIYQWMDSLGNVISTSPGITNLTAGWYYVNLSDLPGCSFSDSVYISQPPCNNLIIATTTSPAACFGQSNGSASVTVLIGTPPYLYTWTDISNNIVSTGSALTNVIPGSYSIEVEDSNHCKAYSNIVINQPTELSTIAAVTQASCFNTYNGTIELSVTGGIFPYTYSWSNGVAVEDLYNLYTGTFSVTVTDDNGCSDSLSVSLVPPSQLTAVITTFNVTCYNGSNGSIDLNPSGGLLPYSYAWSNGAVTQDITNLTSGTYSVTITDQNGCSNNQSVVGYVAQPQPVLNDSLSINCPTPGSGISLVEIFPVGGSGSGYQLSFNNGSSFGSMNDLNEYLPVDSTYILVIKDSNNCVSFLNDTITILPELEISSIAYNKCTPSNATNAWVEVFVSGGTGSGYSISMNNGSTFNPAGTLSDSVAINNFYQVVAKDSIGCLSMMDSIFIPAAINFSGVVSLYNGVNISCFGMSDGNIDVTMLGWTSPFSYSWNTNVTTQDLNNVTAGTYSIIVTDFNNCHDTLDFNLVEPVDVGLTTNITSDYNGYPVSCYGSTDAGINLTINGGILPYTTNWSNGSGSEDLSNIGAGNYEVMVTDNNGCLDSISVLISQPDSININYTSTPILCNSFSTASINATVVGGVTAYDYNWSSGEITEDLTNIPAGNYQLIVTDLNGCQDSVEVSITQPTDILVSGSLTHVLCYGDSTAAIDLNVAGGSGSYSYNWSNGSATEDLDTIPSGSYTVIVFDLNNCTDTTSYIISQPTDLVASIMASTNYNNYNVSCFGLTDAAIDVTVNGGVLPYTFLWSTTDTTEDISGIGAGSYFVLITDSHNCVRNLPITLTEPTQLQISGIVEDVLCNGNGNGSINITLGGGIPSYTYDWSNSAITEDINNIGPGTYSVTVTDQNGCTITYNNTVAELAALIINSSITSPSCFGFNNGSIDISMQGGTQPYSYIWSTGSGNEDLDSLVAGTYSLTVIDSNNCSASDTIAIDQPQELVLDLTATVYGNGYNVTAFGEDDGFIYSTVNGGSSPYQYLWSTGYTGPDLSNITSGVYVLQLTDLNGCFISDTIVLNQPDSLEMPTGYTPNNDGFNDAFIVHGLDNYPNNYIQVVNRWGNIVFEKNGYDNTWKGENLNGGTIPDGTYFVILEVRDINTVLKSYVDIRR